MESTLGQRLLARGGFVWRAFSAGLFASVLLAAPWAAAAPTLRSPQVTLGGTGLQAFLDSRGESIDVQQDQIVGELVRSNVSNLAPFTIQFELGATGGGTTIGLYNGHDQNPVLMPVFPASAVAGWFAVASYRLAPTRVIINVFDRDAVLYSTQTFLGGDRNAIGFFVLGPGGMFYAQDHRNPNGAPQCLFFPGTGIFGGSMWLAFEGQPFVGGDRDFEDAVLFVESGNSGIVDNLHTTWGQLKQRFR
ncbi:MAG: hypothetical protein ABL977_13770 [Candidatus Eisenbacteria bacterium]